MKLFSGLVSFLEPSTDWSGWKVNHVHVTLLAVSEQEAVGKMIEFGRQSYPHDAIQHTHAYEIDADLIEAAHGFHAKKKSAK